MQDSITDATIQQSSATSDAAAMKKTEGSMAATKVGETQQQAAAEEEELGIFEHRYEFCGQKVFIEENFNAGLGGTMFDGAACIANYIEYLFNTDPNTFNGKRVVELGAGCGLPGLLCGKLNSNVVLTDIEETVELLMENIAHNEMDKTVKTYVLDWEKEKDLDGFVKEYLDPDTSNGFFASKGDVGVDFILAADTIYSVKAVPHFLKVVRALSNPNTRTIFAHPKSRHEGASALFWGVVGEQFTVEKIPSTMFAQGKGFRKPTEGVFVLRLRQ